MTAEARTRALKDRAAAEGFDLIGVAAADALDRDAVALDAWLDAGRHATMAWMERYRDRRVDPRKLLPGCRSVVVVAMNYWPGNDTAETPAGRAHVALYARGRDYHKVMGEKLKRLAAWLAEESGESTRAFVDTAPLLERAWAQRAGLGWIGKNANLLTRSIGSWLLLGELLSAAELQPDSGPHAEHCGTCTACLDACPTGAIVDNGVVDSRACISYWTIEHRGAVVGSAGRETANGSSAATSASRCAPGTRRTHVQSTRDVSRGARICGGLTHSRSWRWTRLRFVPSTRALR